MMKKCLLLFSCVACIGFFMQAQTVVLSRQQRKVLDAVATDEQRVDSLNKWAYDVTDTMESRALAKEALALATRIKYDKGRSDSYTRLGQATEDAKEQEKYYRQALTIRKNLGIAPLIAGCYISLGNMYDQQGEIDSAITYFKLGLKTMENQQLHVNTAKLHNNLAGALMELGYYWQARYHLTQCLAIYAQNPPLEAADDPLQNKKGVAAAMLNIAAFLQDNLYLYREAKDTLLIAFEQYKLLRDTAYLMKCYLLLGNNAYFTNNLKEALRNYQSGLDLPYGSNDDRAKLQKNRGRVYLDQGKFKRALKDFRIALDAFISQGNPREIAATQSEIGNYYYELSDMKQAVKYYKTALSDTSLQAPFLEGRLLRFLADALDQLGRKEEAGFYTQRYIEVIDQLNSAETLDAFRLFVQNMEESNRVQRRIQEFTLKSVRLKNLMLTVVLILLAALVLFYAYSNRQKRLLAEQKEQTYIQEKLSLLREKELEINYARLDGQNDMQQKIGRELHDDVGALLTAIKLNLGSFDETLDTMPPEKRRQYQTAINLLDETCEHVRRISHELSLTMLAKFGLQAQLEALADSLSHTGKLQIDLVTHGLQERLDSKLEMNVYRIVQELTNNVIKHANAQKIGIQVNHFEDILHIMVEDDGKGFSPDSIKDKPGVGLKNIASRVNDLGGDMGIDSSTGKGTTTFIDIPCTNLYTSGANGKNQNYIS